MAKKKAVPTEIPKTILVKPREILKKELNERIVIGQELHSRNIQTPEEFEQLKRDFSNWDDYNEELIKRAFNSPTNEYYNEYSRVNQMMGLFDSSRKINTNHPAYKLKLAKDKIDNCNTFLTRLVEKLPLIEQDGSIQTFQTEDRVFYNKGFIVHGHDEARKFEVARYVENDLRVKAIILHEQPNKGKTIIEKFESHSLVDFAIAIWTADDLGESKKVTELKQRARQNVIFETGFFIGKIGRENVIVLYEDGIEIPSDYSGVIFISLDGNWKDDLRKEINSIYGI